MNISIEIQLEQNRLNLVEQELLRLERELSEQQMLEEDCKADEVRLEGNSAMPFPQKEVQAFSPTLAGRKAMTTASMTPADIADELVSLLAKEKE